MTELSRDVFRPREGALLDLASLEVLAASQRESLEAWLSSRWPGAKGLILEGLDIEGTPAPTGPPGTVRPDGLAGGMTLSAGKAVITAQDGRLYLVELPEPMHVPWPDGAGARVRGDLVLYAAHLEDVGEAGVGVSRQTLTVKLGFVKPDLADQPQLVPLARALGNGQDWTTDLARILHPEHQAVKQLVKRFEKLEQAVWRAEPEGAVWDRQVLGRSWVRYQTVAASAIQAATMQLATQSMTTLERVRLLTALKVQLERSVERTATELLQIIGSLESSGPYRAVAGVEA